jgi:hypothetical protein
MFTGDDNEVVISVRPKKKGFPKETREAYFSRINQSLDALDKKHGNLSFSVEEFEKLN